MSNTCKILPIGDNEDMGAASVNCPMSQRSRLVAALMALAAIGLTACGPASVVEGVANTESFEIADPQPLYRADSRASGRLLIMMSQEGEDKLEVVSVTIPDKAEIVLDEDLAAGPEASGAAFVSVARGDLVVTHRSDGVRILSTDNTVINESQDGYIRFTSVEDPWAGEFSVTLEGGGYAEGSFVVDGDNRG